MEYIPAGGGARRAFESVRSTGVCEVGVLCIAAADGSPWLAAPSASGSQSTYQSGGCLTSPRLSDYIATFLKFIFKYALFYTHTCRNKKNVCDSVGYTNYN